MLEKLSSDEFIALAKTKKRVAVFREIMADRLTPISIIENMGEKMPDATILESALLQDGSRYTYIAFDVTAQLRVANNVVLQRIGAKVTTHAAHPFTVLRQLLAQQACATKESIMKFVGGTVGLMTYDAVRMFETIPDRHTKNNSLPEMLFNFFQTALVFDHLQEKLLITTIVDVSDNPQQCYQQAEEKINVLIKQMKTTVHSDGSSSPVKKKKKTAVEMDIDDEKFMQLVAQAKKYIAKGDAFQIVLSRCFRQDYSVSPFDIYRALRRVNPAPYLFHMPVDQSVIVGASPEKMISVQNGQVEINPIAGTRKRAKNDSDDHIRDALLSDKKERAEHMMLVDLARNDLGVVCEPASVKVKDLLRVKHFSHVSHITSVITGRLRENKDALDALAAAFPAGTLSGAPKIRAMQIIDELETSKRGMYGGVICRLDQQGNLDSCIAIRMAVLADGVATVRVGAGIVHDSDPHGEANETRYKAQGLLDAIAMAHEGLT